MAGGGGPPPPPPPPATRITKDLNQNRREWQRYLSKEVPQLECSDPALTRYWYYVWHILRANRCAPGAHIRHAWTAPSKYMYWGPWIWDGYFHVLGEMWLADPQVAWDSIRAVLDMQFPNGFIPVCSGADYRMCFHDKVEGYTPPGGFGGYASYVPPELSDYKEGKHPFEAVVNDFTHNEKTQTPLITLAAAELLRLRGNELPGGKQAAARELLGPLWAYEQWLWRRRTDRQGRFILWHGDESGWDDATRHYPVPCRPYDVQVHCLLHREALREIMLAAGETRRLTEVDKRIARTRKALDTYWHSSDYWNYDLAGDGKASNLPTNDAAKMAALPGSDTPYRNQIAASSLFGLLADTRPHVVDSALFALGCDRVFASEYPIPTLAICDPDYKPHGWGWNGPVWLQVNYFVLTGLLRAARGGRRDALDAAWKLWEQTQALVIRDGQPHSYELYDPETGTGMGCPDYSWQAMLLHLIIHEFAGVPVGTRFTPPASSSETTVSVAADAINRVPTVIAPALPPSLSHLRLTRLPGALSAIELTRDGAELRISLRLAQPGHVALNDSGLGGCQHVRLADGSALLRCAPSDSLWRLPEGPRPRREWVIIAACR